MVEIRGELDGVVLKAADGLGGLSEALCGLCCSAAACDALETLQFGLGVRGEGSSNLFHGLSVSSPMDSRSVDEIACMNLRCFTGLIPIEMRSVASTKARS